MNPLISQLPNMPIPYRCPICAGTQIVPKGFYTPDFTGDTNEAEGCRSCSATGIIWFVAQGANMVPIVPQNHGGKGRM